MSENRYEIVEDSQIEITEAEMEAVSRVPLPLNSLWFTTVRDDMSGHLITPGTYVKLRESNLRRIGIVLSVNRGHEEFPIHVDWGGGTGVHNDNELVVVGVNTCSG